MAASAAVAAGEGLGAMIQVSAPKTCGDREINPFDAIGARMECLASAMSEKDGVRIFNDLYLAVTRSVADEFANGYFEDPAFLSRLGAIFSDRYFDAVERNIAERSVSRAWAPLFQERSETRIAPLGLALAGMNAHINNDLAIAIVAAARELGYDLDLDSAHYRDHLRVNMMLLRLLDDVKEHLETGIVQTNGRFPGPLAWLVAGWSIVRARESAWTRAQRIAALDDAPRMRQQYLLALAWTVGVVSRVLLCCTAPTRRGGGARGSRCSRPARAWRRGATA